VLLPIPWQCDQVDQIRDAVVQVFEEFQQGMELDVCVARMPCAQVQGANADAGLRSALGQGGRARHRGGAALDAPGDWDALIAAFPEYKLISGEIKPSTWHRVYRHPMNHVLGAAAAPDPPQNAKQLLEGLARIWAVKPGRRTRQIQIQSTAALLRWAVAERRLGEDWEPPQGLTVFVGRSRAAKAITTPLLDESTALEGATA
jgi:hypothetical protein